MLKRCFAYCIFFYIGFSLITCASSPMVSLQTARIKHKWHGSYIYQLRHIESHDAFRSPPLQNGKPWHGWFDYNSNSNASLIRIGYGWDKGETGWETGVQMGLYSRFHWSFPIENNATNYFLHAGSDMQTFYFNPYLKFGFNQQSRLKFAMLGELRGASFTGSYDFKRITPYASIKLAVTRLEEPNYEWQDLSQFGRFYKINRYDTKVSLLPLVGCEIKLSPRSQVIFEGGFAHHYFRNNTLYIFGFGFTVD